MSPCRDPALENCASSVTTPFKLSQVLWEAGLKLRWPLAQHLLVWSSLPFFPSTATGHPILSLLFFQCPHLPVCPFLPLMLPVRQQLQVSRMELSFPLAADQKDLSNPGNPMLGELSISAGKWRDGCYSKMLLFCLN